MREKGKLILWLLIRVSQVRDLYGLVSPSSPFANILQQAKIEIEAQHSWDLALSTLWRNVQLEDLGKRNKAQTTWQKANNPV